MEQCVSSFNSMQQYKVSQHHAFNALLKYKSIKINIIDFYLQKHFGE